MANGQRADTAAVAAGLARSRTEAQRLIDDGRLSLRGAAGQAIPIKASTRVPLGAQLVRGDDPANDYVSRGALKLAHALREFAIAAEDRLAADIGQSTGGFTECLLRAGARRVVGVEVGHGQLAASLRADPRVVTLERTHVRDADRARLAHALYEAAGDGALHAAAAADAGRIRSHGFDLIVVDLSFISQRQVLAPIAALLADKGDLVSLVKPQFELGPGAVDRRGLVRDAQARAGLRPLFEQALAALGLTLRGWSDSPITGGDGNHEMLMHARRG
ncbi:MAG: TlyA family RNA methyltransferase [Burkholderiaceae bacterium]